VAVFNQVAYALRDLGIRADLGCQAIEYPGPDIQASEIADVQWPDGHQSQAQAATNRCIDVFRRGQTLIQQVPDLAQHGHLDTVDQKSWHFAVQSDRLFARVFKQGHCRRHSGR
jgi:hypothetical protein